MHSWNNFGARMNHEQTHIHKTHHSPNLEEATTLYAWPQGLHPNVILSRDSQVANFEILKIRTSTTLEAHNFFYKPPIEVRSKTKL